MRRHLGGTLIAAAAVALALAALPAGSQVPDDPRIMPDLRAELSRLPAGEKMRVIIRMKDQLSAEERDRAVAGVGNARDPKSKLARRKALSKALRDHAERSQRSLRGALKELEGQGLVRKVRRSGCPTWSRPRSIPGPCPRSSATPASST